MKQHFLFIDISNARGSLAVDFFENTEDIEARTVGFFPLTGTKISKEAIDWANKIFVFNEKNELLKTQMLQKYPFADEKEIIDLNINPNIFGNELLEELKLELGKYLN